jgi:hypothetical protein
LIGINDPKIASGIFEQQAAARGIPI